MCAPVIATGHGRATQVLIQALLRKRANETINHTLSTYNTIRIKSLLSFCLCCALCDVQFPLADERVKYVGNPVIPTHCQSSKVFFQSFGELEREGGTRTAGGSGSGTREGRRDISAHFPV